MPPEEITKYHSTRAREELDRGLTAEGFPAAEAHLKLASLHMQRLRELAGTIPDEEVPAPAI